MSIHNHTYLISLFNLVSHPHLPYPLDQTPLSNRRQLKLLVAAASYRADTVVSCTVCLDLIKSLF